MDFSEGFKVSLASMKANKLRSLLTMLGVIIGISSVIGVVSIGTGAKSLILNEFERVGGASMIEIHREDWVRTERGWERNRSPEHLGYEDAILIQDTISHVLNVTPEININVKVEFEGEAKDTRLSATTPEYQTGRRWTAQLGRFISKEDFDSANLVCVIGTKIWKELCHNQYVIGSELRLNGERFNIVGIMVEKGDSMATRGWDDIVFIPLSTAQKRFMGNRWIRQILVQAESSKHVDQVEDSIKRLLAQRHRESDKVFRVWTAKNEIKNVNKVTRIIQVFLGGVASIALLVGGIGIMNIMLVSVTERTPEIGLRKAVGAKRRHILFQFLIEASTLSLVGGFLGIGLGFLMGLGGAKLFSTFVTRGVNWPSIVSPQAAFVAFTFSVMVGIFFGFYPAYLASKLTPTEALRYK